MIILTGLATAAHEAVRSTPRRCTVDGTWVLVSRLYLGLFAQIRLRCEAA